MGDATMGANGTVRTRIYPLEVTIMGTGVISTEPTVANMGILFSGMIGHVQHLQPQHLHRLPVCQQLAVCPMDATMRADGTIRTRKYPLEVTSTGTLVANTENTVTNMAILLPGMIGHAEVKI